MSQHVRVQLIDRLRGSLGWPLLALFALLILSSTGAQLHGRLLTMGDWLFGDYYLLRGDLPAPSCNPEPDIEARLEKLRQDAEADSGLDDLLGDSAGFDEQAARQSLEGAQALCQEKHQIYENSRQRVTLAVRLFRSVEIGVEFFTLFVFDYQRLFIICLLFLGGISATLGQHHISFRPIRTLREHRFVHGLELLAITGLFLPSTFLFYTQKQAGLNQGYAGFEGVTLIGVLLLAAMSFWRLICPPPTLEQSRSSLAQMLLCVPIYIYMMLIAGYYFFLVENHSTGISIYIGQLFEQSEMFLKVGLYIWLGMLLKRSLLGQQLFDVFRPWGFSPEIMAFLAVLLMAVPTAYTGASGIIIIAMGAVVYKELVASGARRNLALAATAMTGSAGVVLRPCLIIVIIAALNKEVVTDDLYTWGGRVFALSAVVLLVFLMASGQSSMRMNPWRDIKTPFLQALRALLYPLMIFIGITVLYRVLLDAKLDEISAPIILPVILIAILWFERRTTSTRALPADNRALHSEAGITSATGQVHAAPSTDLYQPGLFASIVNASKEASLHVGALLMLMALSFTIGGVIERAEIVSILPETFQSVWVCMAMLVMLLVLIGMVMDPFGAVVLVSGSIAAIAYNNGIDPLHFWMVTLVAFELGYLSPPVALNHLLTRQVVGEDEAMQAQLEAQQATHFWWRHEKFLLPIVVMLITLLVTAFVPLLM